MNNNIEHHDRLGRLLKVGDCVAYPVHNSLEIGTIKKCNPKMIKVSKLGSKGMRTSGNNKYPNDLVLLEGPYITMWLLKFQ